MIDNVNNHRENGFTIEALNRMEYKANDDLDNSDPFHTYVNCKYVLPSEFQKSVSNLSIMSFNIRSTKTNWINFKTELYNGHHACEIIGLCETHLTDVTEKLYSLDGYDCFTTNVCSNKGGVCMFVRSSLNVKLRNDLVMLKDHIETIFIECTVNGEPLVIGMVYHRPGTSSQLFLEDMDEILEKINSKCILMGDLNINLLDDTNNTVNDLINYFREHSYLPYITKPTRVSNNTATLIDHIWFNNIDTNEILESNILFTDVTDHYAVVLHLPVRNNVPKYKYITFRLSGQECDNAFKTSLENYNFDELMTVNDVDQAFESFNDIIYNIYNNSYPEVVKRINSNAVHKPWLTAGIKQSIQNKNKLYKKLIKRPITYGPVYRQYRNTLTKVIRCSKNKLYQEQLNNCTGNSKQTWKTLNKILGKNGNSQSKLIRIDDTLTDDANIIANKFNEYYSSIATTVTGNLAAANRDFREYLEPRNVEMIDWQPTNEAEVKRIVNKLNNVKPGPDKIPISIIKKNIDFLCPILTHLVNLSLTSGVFPTVHKRGIITPLYKNNDRHDITNYRPICLLNAISKLLEKIASQRILKHLEENNLLTNAQNAYRKGRGTETAVTKFVNDVLRGFDDNKFTIAVFLDLTKAFDCVSHEILIKKLEYYGINNLALNWVRTYLNSRQQVTKFNGILSTIQTTNIGVPQGSILGPLLFLVYINDLANLRMSGELLLFADDANKYESGENFFSLLESVNRNLTEIVQWFLSNKLAINLIKTEAMVLSRKPVYFPLPPVILGNDPICYSHAFKFLGVIIDHKLSWKFHINKIRNKLSSVCGVMFQIRNKITTRIAKLVYNSLALPHLSYCSVIWCSSFSTNFKNLRTPQKKLIRFIMKKRRFDHTTELFRQLEILKLDDLFKFNTLNFVYKSINNFIYSPIQFVGREIGPYNLRNPPSLIVPLLRSTQSTLFIHARGANLWNELPYEIRNSRSIFIFKRKLKTKYLQSYV